MAGNSEMDRWIETLKRCEPLKEHEVKVLCQKALEVLVEESNVQRVDAPVTVCESRAGAHGRAVVLVVAASWRVRRLPARPHQCSWTAACSCPRLTLCRRRRRSPLCPL